MRTDEPNSTQGDLFGAPVTAAQIREEVRFGTWDAKCGLALRNYYSERIVGERLATYQAAFREERARGK